MSDSSREAGYEGARRAADHAERVIPAWSKLARVAFLRFLIASGSGATFVTHEAYAWCLANGLPPAPDPRAMGNPIRHAAGKGLIRDTGERPRVGCHGRETVRWIIS